MKIKLSKIRLNKIKLPKLAPNIDKRLSKLTSSIGFYRTLSRISAMEDEGKMLESAKQVIKESRHFKGCADDVINDAANRLIIESKKYKFKNDNYEILNSWYKAIKAFGKAKIPVRSLPPRTVIFYDEVSDFKNFDGFVDKVYKYAVEHKADFESAYGYINELEDAIGRSKFEYRNISIVNGGKDEILVYVPNDFKKLKDDLKKKIERMNSNKGPLQRLADDRINKLKSLFGEIDYQEGNDIRRVMNEAGIKQTVDLYNSDFNASNVEKRKEELANLFKNNKNHYDITSDKIELVSVIYFVNSYASFENVKTKIEAQFKEIKDKLMKKQQKKNKEATTLPPQSNSQSSSGRKGGGKVAELRK